MERQRGSRMGCEEGFVATQIHSVCTPEFHFCLHAGSTKSWDHCKMVHTLWLQLAELQTAVWVLRVPTKENIADDPSRWSITAFARAHSFTQLTPFYRKGGLLPAAQHGCSRNAASLCRRVPFSRQFCSLSRGVSVANNRAAMHSAPMIMQFNARVYIAPAFSSMALDEQAASFWTTQLTEHNVARDAPELRKLVALLLCNEMRHFGDTKHAGHPREWSFAERIPTDALARLGHLLQRDWTHLECAVCILHLCV